MQNLIVKAFISYIESHPEVLEQLVERLVHAALDALAKKAQ